MPTFMASDLVLRKTDFLVNKLPERNTHGISAPIRLPSLSCPQMLPEEKKTFKKSFLCMFYTSRYFNCLLIKRASIS